MFMGLDGHRLMREIENENKKRSDDDRIRDEFAMAALTGLLSDPAVKPEDGESSESWHKAIASSCYEIADAMMEARK